MKKDETSTANWRVSLRMLDHPVELFFPPKQKLNEMYPLDDWKKGVIFCVRGMDFST